MRGLGVSGQRQIITQPVAVNPAESRVGIVTIGDAIILAHCAKGHIKVAQVFTQQGVGHIKRHRGRYLAPDRIGGDDCRFTGTVDIRHIGEGKRPGVKIIAAGLKTIEKQVNGAGDRSCTAILQQRIGHQIRAQGKIAADA
ncbi:hypothetical protein D3C80_1586970 [compost metagenome]